MSWIVFYALFFTVFECICWSMQLVFLDCSFAFLVHSKSKLPWLNSKVSLWKVENLVHFLDGLPESQNLTITGYRVVQCWENSNNIEWVVLVLHKWQMLLETYINCLVMKPEWYHGLPLGMVVHELRVLSILTVHFPEDYLLLSYHFLLCLYKCLFLRDAAPKFGLYFVFHLYIQLEIIPMILLP